MAAPLATVPAVPPLTWIPVTLLMLLDESVPVLFAELLLFTVKRLTGVVVPAAAETVTPDAITTSSGAPLLAVAVVTGVVLLVLIVVDACAVPAAIQRGASATAAIKVLRI